MTRRGDLAFVAETAPTPPAVAPVAGLVNVANIVAGGEVSTSLDELVDLVGTLQNNLSTPTHILLDPLGWAEFRKLKAGTDLNTSLLGARTTDAATMMLSLPVVVNRAVPDCTGIAVDKNAVVSAVGPVMISVSEHHYFASDSVGVRATCRLGHVVVRPNRIGTFTITQPGS